MPLGLAALIVIPDARKASGATPAQSASGLKLLRRPALLGVYAFTLALSVMMYSVAVFLPQRLGDLGVEAPILVSVYIMAWPATQSLIGLAYARLRARASYLTLLQFSTLACVAAFLILGSVDEPLALSAATVFLGAGTGVVLSALSVLIADLIPEALLGRATAMSSTALFVGQFISPLALGPLMAATSITMGHIAVAGLAASILAILTIIAVKRPTQGERNANAPNRTQGL